MSEIIQLLGRGQNDSVLEKFLQEIDTKEERDTDDELERIYSDYPESGVCFLFQQGICTTIFLYSEGHEEHRSFKGKIPNGLEFGQSRLQVRSQFPVLLKQGGGKIGMLGEKVPIWDLFLWQLNHVHVQYNDSLEVAKMVTLSAPKEEIPENKAQGNESLIIFCIPSLVATLLNRERAKGSPLTEEEVLAIRDNAPAIALPPEVARSVADKRGYPDIAADNVWAEWQRARLTLI